MSTRPRWRTDPELLSVTADFFRSKISYDPDSGDLIWLARIDGSRGSNAFNARYAGRVAGRVHPEGYITITARVHGRPRIFMAHRVAWLIHFGSWPAAEVDHKNQDKKDNRASNLRICTRQENCRNSSISIRNKTGYTGVSLHGKSGKYLASMMINYKHIQLGVFDSAEEAAKVAAEARSSAGFDLNHGSLKK